MRLNLFGTIVVGSTLALAGAAVVAAQQAGSTPASSSGQDESQGQGRRGRGMGGFPGDGRGVLGAVTEVAADHYTIKTDSGDTYIVHFSANTRIMKQGPGRRQGGSGDSDGGDRPAPQTLKPTDIKVGDFITAGGEVDAAAKSVGAVFIAQIDPERAKQMREMQANYGKTWLAGRITAIDGTTITIEGIVDHAPHSIVVDENTSFHQRRDAITLADIKPGEQLRAEGAVKAGAFLATTVTAMEPQNRGEGRDQNRDQPSGAPKPQ
jgi:preprotein translocase subunit YajC